MGSPKGSWFWSHRHGVASSFLCAMDAPAGQAGISLPSELWSSVFYWATYSALRELQPEIAPFEDIDNDHFKVDQWQRTSSPSSTAVLQMKTVLVSVCRRWRSIAAPFLYEEVTLRRGLLALADTLSDSRCKPVLASYVRSIVFDQEMNIEAREQRRQTNRILSSCNNAFLLSFMQRGRRLSFERFSASVEFFAVDLVLPQNILRIECKSTTAQPTYPIPGCIWDSPTLRSLTVAGDFAPGSFDELLSDDLRVPDLHTLRILSKPFMAKELHHLRVAHNRLGSLRRLVLGSAVTDVFNFCFTLGSPLGKTLRVLELGNHIEHLKRDLVSLAVSYCPCLEEVYYPIFFTRIPTWCDPWQPVGGPSEFPHVKHVGLHAATNSMHDEVSIVWQQILKHLSALCSVSALTGLERISLHGGEWETIVAHPRFSSILQLSTAVPIYCQYSSVDATMKRVLRDRALT